MKLTLTKKETESLPHLIKILKTRGKGNPIKAPDLVALFNKTTKIKMTLCESRLRKMINNIRAKSIAPVISNHRGYYISYSTTEIAKQVDSLEDRSKSIYLGAKGLRNFIKIRTEI